MFKSAILVTTAVAIAQVGVAQAAQPFELNPIGTYASGVFDASAAEIVAYDQRTQRAFVVNAQNSTVDVLDVSDPTAPYKIDSIDVTAAAPMLGAANSVDVAKGLLAVAVERVPKQANGIVAFYDTSTLALLGTVEVGALPDMLTFTPDGKRVVVANEGEPDDDYLVDPEGTISIIELKKGVAKAKVKTVRFTAFNTAKAKEKLLQDGVRIFGPNASVAQDLEPEYIALDSKGHTAYVSLQENNALAIVDLKKGKVKKIVALGFKDFATPGNEFDASNKDAAINIQSWPVFGMYQPDSIAAYTVKSKTYIVTANEGDGRDYTGYSEEVRIKDLQEDEGKILNPIVFPNAAELVQEEQLGRLIITKTLGDANNDGMMEGLYAFGARSFSIWDKKGKLVWDSGNEIESIIANLEPANFNSTNDANDSFDNRSDDKGPEPEAVAIGNIAGRTYAFIGLERVGGIMMYDISNPKAPEFVTYSNNRDFSVADASDAAAGDLGPEGIEFIAAKNSPNGRALIMVANEVSGTTTIYQIDPVL